MRPLLLATALTLALAAPLAASQDSRLPDIGSSAGELLTPARQAQYGGPADSVVLPGNPVENGIDPERVGRRVLEGILAKDRYILTHPDMRALVQGRFAGIMAGFDAADASPALAGMDYKTPAIGV